MRSAGDPATAEFIARIRDEYAADPDGMSRFGARLLVGHAAPQAPDAGAVLIQQAAEAGSAEACALLAVVAAAGVGRPQSWSDAFSALTRAAELGHAGAAEQVQLMRESGVLRGEDARRWIAAPKPREVHASPRMVAYREFLTASTCAYLIERARPRLVPARVNDARGGGLKLDPMRTNTCAVFSIVETDLITQLVRARIAGVAGVAMHALEPAEILHYGAGETYRLHVDFFHPQLPTFAQEMRSRGQRIKTCLVYLNDDFEAGETEFPRLGIKFRGDRGEALVFDNVGRNGLGDIKTLHAGLPPTRGEKWLFSQWMRSKPQPIA